MRHQVFRYALTATIWGLLGETQPAGAGAPAPAEAISRSITVVNAVEAGANEAVSRALSVVSRVAPSALESISRAWSVCNRVDVGAADLDCDGEVNLADFTTFATCYSGPLNPPAASCPGGVDADLDDDGDVDLADFAIFQQSFTGP